jgi:hypothetical protein
MWTNRYMDTAIDEAWLQVEKWGVRVAGEEDWNLFPYDVLSDACEEVEVYGITEVSLEVANLYECYANFDYLKRQADRIAS